MQKPFRLSVLIASLGLAATSLLSVAHAQNIRIAMVIPTTGALTQYGDMVKEGAFTAVEQVNAAGGIQGKKIELVPVDDACEPKQGPVAANRVVNAKIGYVIGPICSGAAIAAAPIYNNEGVVAVTPSATSPALTDGKNYQFIFRTIGRDDQQGPSAAKFIIEKAKPKKVAVVHDKQSYGQGIATSVRDALQKAGISVALFEGINAGDSDYSAVITKLKSNGVDFVYYGGYHPEMGLLLRQAAEQGLKVRMMGPEGVGNPEVNAIAGNAVEGMLVTMPADFASNPKNAAVVKAFQDKKRSPSGAFQMTSYAAAQVLLDSIKAVGDNPAKVAEHLRKTNFETALGTVGWNRQGDLKAFDFQVFEWHKDGSKTPAVK
ncbi:branched-chain amino acid ABC transporter substrate-binding protein [Comamonas endophytica]|uniref:Branched-chain amino acid ABC transporter substrate-binding protein n=1 Tax=Comamonas endophytica TaxID=2949090 RepID=A0ABY6G9V2_9BURK|nr:MULTISPECIES: branched-chain amino acid ABC transporter substrate-binding protein [unclassified Acidovorax]MCD2512028.1 branched-chain amino acid ABC transporter substrate-binding protein [Acidovorax sp. D4N7]UYG51808.1 branched-chain amino acid ABC transporter substrate-binding protein [Acidovorax sp. 5MLIR]